VTQPRIPDVDETDLTRDEMEEVASELGVDPEGLDDQQLLEQLGVALGELDEDQVEAPPASSDEVGDAGSDDDEPDDDEPDDDEPDDDGEVQSAVGEPIDGPTRDDLRDRLRELDLPVSGTKDELQQRLAEAGEDV
jgi:hypothetical protein